MHAIQVFSPRFLIVYQRYIRGNGLAYGAYASLDVESGILNFSLYRVSHTSIHAPLILETDGPQSSNSTKAYEEASKVIKGLVDGSVRPLFSFTKNQNNNPMAGQIEFDQTILDAAKSTIVYGVAKNVSTAGRAVRDVQNISSLLVLIFCTGHCIVY